MTRKLLFALIVTLLLPQTVAASAAIDDLEHEMYRLFYTEDSTAFRETVARLRQTCEAEGNEKLYYRAWGNLAIYETTHRRQTHGLEIAREMEQYAKQHESVYGTYSAKHVMGAVYHQMRDYADAESTFKEAIDYLHKNAPGESAAADYIELILINVNGYTNISKGLAYATKALEEPNISPQHRLRVLTMLCQLEGEKPDPDPEVFNKYYNERLQTKSGTPADRADKAVETLHYFVNGDYQNALVLSDSLSTIDQCIFEKARIYHKMGDDRKAYLLMINYKQTRDSLYRAERQVLVSEYTAQLNLERLTLKTMELEKKNGLLIAASILMAGALFIILLVWIIRQRVKLTRRLRDENAQLDQAHKEAQEARLAEQKQRRKAERELDVKREFLSNIAHELRNPLNPITGFSDILASPDFELEPEERQMMSQHIKESSKTLTSIIDNMIELSLYESKTSLPKDDVFSPNLVAQNAVDYGKTKVKEGVSVSLVTELSSKLNIKSDMTAVRNVLYHLVNNAAKFTEQGGIIIYCTDQGRTVRFTITDSGRGISPEQADHIFDPLTQSGEDVKTTGMGLAICTRITKLLNGTLEYDSAYKRGSRFHFEIPKE